MRWSREDGEAVTRALLEAGRNPVKRPFDKRKLAYRPRATPSKIGPVTIPAADEAEAPEDTESKRPREHTEIQWYLLKLGMDMGFDLWVARNDKGRSHNGNRFSDLPRLKSELPLQFDKETNSIIEMIDVIWLKGKAIAAAFEVESTTSIYSGLLRMADLTAMQPNVNIPLYLVAPDERREKVMTEVNRPTFARLTPPLSEIVRFISFSVLKGQLEKVTQVIRYLKPEFLEEISESCALEE